MRCLAMQHCAVRIIFISLLSLIALPSSADDVPAQPPLTEVTVVSSLDQEDQPVRYWAPPSATTEATPMLVFLHSWSADYRQDNSKWQQEAVRRRWIYLHPNFRGVNQTPKACGSRFARQDILDAMDFASRQFKVDSSRIYLAGTSGGGHMAMLMAGHHPDRFSAVSAWVGISDLADWYQFHLKDGKPQKYAQMIVKSLGGAPASSDEIDADYHDRSPLFHLHQIGSLPVDIAAGVNDGHAGSVPVSHSLKAFNVIAGINNSPLVSDAEMQQLWMDRHLATPQPTDTAPDRTLGRDIRLRRTAGASRVTIFEGGHESIPPAACEWLEQHRRPALTK